ncbi:unnamed protein product [Allacma fusca]|uniref:CRAL-TRIO domain-containing protein n=1 Tax=Allacma fusca TaxID=39272 RepID=A0A8J2Q136_9HEXA|nr:unnamed protein product [Allacma fusca]
MDKFMHAVVTALLLILTISFGVLAAAEVDTESAQNQELTLRVSANSSLNSAKLSEDVYLKCYSIMRHSRVFRNFTYEDVKKFLDEALAFKPPAFLQDRFPYYLAGYDYEDRPVWVAEWGKYKVDDLVDRVFELFPIFESMSIQGAINVAKSFVDRDKQRPGKDIRQYVGIVDCEGFDVSLAYKVLARPELIDFGIKLAELYLDIGDATVAQMILINANYAAKLFVDLSRPVVGSLIDRLVVLGTNKYKWKGELRRYLPEETIPTWYGGSKDFKPLAVFA